MERGVFGALAERLTSSLINGDLDTYLSITWLPLRIQSRDDPAYTLADAAQVSEDFNLYHQALTLNQVTDIYREINEIVRLSDDVFEVSCTTNILEHANRVVGPFVTEFLVIRKSQDWRISKILSSTGHIRWSMLKTEITPDKRFASDDRGNA